MSARFDRLGGLEQLGGLRDALREREIREREAERRRREDEARRAREASVFQREVAGASPLKPTGRVDFRRPSAEPVPRQREQVIAFCQARPNDGGSGALVALLQVSRRAGSAPARPAR